MKQALSASEWAETWDFQYCPDCRRLDLSDQPAYCFECHGHNGSWWGLDEIPLAWWNEVDGDVTRNGRHAVAALALHGQDFGFRWEDVDLIRDVCDEDLDISYGPHRHGPRLSELADRIESLLPPRTP